MLKRTFIHYHSAPKITTMCLKLLYKKHFCDILVLLERALISFNELEKTVGVYPDTLNKRLNKNAPIRLWSNRPWILQMM